MHFYILQDELVTFLEQLRIDVASISKEKAVTEQLVAIADSVNALKSQVAISTDTRGSVKEVEEMLKGLCDSMEVNKGASNELLKKVNSVSAMLTKVSEQVRYPEITIFLL